MLRAAERKSLADVMDIFAQFGPDFMKEGRFPQEQDERDWDGIGAGSFSVQEPCGTYAANSVAEKKITKAKLKATAAKTSKRK